MKIVLDRKDIENAIAAEMLRKFPGYAMKLEQVYNISGEIEVVLSEPVHDTPSLVGGAYSQKD